MYKYRHKNRLLANLYARSSSYLPVHPHDRLPPPVARGPRSLGALQRHKHTQKTIIKRFVCVEKGRYTAATIEAGTEGSGRQMRIDRAADEPLMTVITITIMIILQ